MVWISVEANIASGKTTFLKSCLSHIPMQERLILLQDTPEIDLKRFFDGTDPSLVIKDLAEIGNIDNRDAVYIYPEGILPSINLNEIKDYSSVFNNYFKDNHKIIIGITRYKEAEVFNSMVFLDNNLELISVYDKNKLVPFGPDLVFCKC